MRVMQMDPFCTRTGTEIYDFLPMVKMVGSTCFRFRFMHKHVAS